MPDLAIDLLCYDTSPVFTEDVTSTMPRDRVLLSDYYWVFRGESNPERTIATTNVLGNMVLGIAASDLDRYSIGVSKRSCEGRLRASGESVRVGFLGLSIANNAPLPYGELQHNGIFNHIATRVNEDLDVLGIPYGLPQIPSGEVVLAFRKAT